MPLNVPLSGTFAGQTALNQRFVPPFVPLSGTFAGQNLKTPAKPYAVRLILRLEPRNSFKTHAKPYAVRLILRLI